MNQAISKFLLVIFLFSSPAQKILAQSWQQKVSPGLLQKFEEQPVNSFIVVMKEQADLSQAKSIHGKNAKGNFVYGTLTTLASQSQPDIQEVLQNENVGYQSFWVVNALRVDGDETLLQQLARRDDVAQILNNTAMGISKPLNAHDATARDIVIPWGVDTIHAPAVWALGIKGAGVVVGGQDTGYDWEHPAIKNQYRGWDGSTLDNNYNWHDNIHAPDPHNLYPNPCGIDIKSPCDDYGHGTHTMGTMVGLDDSLQIGIAPEARWIGERNMEQGWGNLASYMEGFQWFIAPTDTNNLNADPAMAPHVINDSWVCITDEGCDQSNFSLLETVVDNTKAAGIVVVASAGNDGPYCNTIFYPPAMYASSFSVGAIDSTLTIAGFSSRGNVTADSSGIMKPNVTAPGVDVLSCIPGDQYAYYSGTSMAGPHTVGTVALMISANPMLSGEVDEIETIIESTAHPVTTNDGCGGDAPDAIPNNTYGWGIIDAYAAVQQALLVTSADIYGDEGNISVFPTLTRDELLVNTGAAGNGILHLYTIQGQAVAAFRLSASQNTIHLKTLPQGIYLYRVVAGASVKSGKVLKQ